MFHAVSAATFQKVAEVEQVGVDVGQGVIDGISDTGLGRQIHHPLRLILGKGLLHAFTIFQFEP